LKLSPVDKTDASNRLDNVPISVEHLNVTAAIARTLLSVIQRVWATKPQKTSVYD